MTISVCTLAHGREDHLRNLVSGLNHSRRPPCELVVAVMQDNRYDLPSTSFPVRQVLLGSKGICLAEARNTAAEHARGELLIFLDVDCIPAPGLIEDYAAASAFNEGVLMGEVGYLPQGATEHGIDYAQFERLAVTHRDRAGPPRGMVGHCGDYRCFWSLNFALPAATFRDLGGFDPRYLGYGGEDTDFGRTIAAHDVPLWWARGAKIWSSKGAGQAPDGGGGAFGGAKKTGGQGGENMSKTPARSESGGVIGEISHPRFSSSFLSSICVSNSL